MNTRKFFRSAGLVLAAGTIFSSAAVLSACGDDDDDADSSTPTMAAGDATTPTMAAGGDATTPTMAAGATTMPSESETFTAGDIEVTNVRARATTNPNSAVYMNITSTGEADRLVSASVAEDVAVEAQVHETVVDGSAMKMQELEDGLPIPADGMVELKTGGYHVMLLDLKEPLVAGEELTLTLEFEKAGPLEITAPIMDIAGGGMMR